jgi:hypothetical protein
VVVVTELVDDDVMLDGVPMFNTCPDNDNAKPLLVARVTSPVLLPLTDALPATLNVYAPP